MELHSAGRRGGRGGRDGGSGRAPPGRPKRPPAAPGSSRALPCGAGPPVPAPGRRRPGTPHISQSDHRERRPPQRQRAVGDLLQRDHVGLAPRKRGGLLGQTRASPRHVPLTMRTLEPTRPRHWTTLSERTNRAVDQTRTASRERESSRWQSRRPLSRSPAAARVRPSSPPCRRSRSSSERYLRGCSRAARIDQHALPHR